MSRTKSILFDHVCVSQNHYKHKHKLEKWKGQNQVTCIEEPSLELWLGREGGEVLQERVQVRPRHVLVQLVPGQGEGGAGQQQCGHCDNCDQRNHRDFTGV